MSLIVVAAAILVGVQRMKPAERAARRLVHFGLRSTPTPLSTNCKVKAFR